MPESRPSLRTIFCEALDRPTPQAQAAYLDEACKGRPALRGRVEALLQTQAEVGGFLEEPAPTQVGMVPDGDGKIRGDPELYDFLAPAQGPGELGRLGPYGVLKVLGAGGMGIVFLAEDSGLGRHVALKVMKPALAVSADFRKRFVREARAAAALKHDRVIVIHQVGEDRGVPFLAMELLEGESLQERVQRKPALPLAEVLRIGAEIGEGLTAAHDRGLIHRDIKPGNIWLETPRPTHSLERGEPPEGGRVKILDFGLARSAEDSEVTHPGAVLGTPAYMSPEQARAQHVDARSDLFSLGGVLYRLCTGELPFQGIDLVGNDAPKAPHEINAAVPPELSTLILQLLARDRANRPASARAVVGALQGMQRLPTAAVNAPPPLATHAVPRARSWRRAPFMAAAVTIGVLTIAVLVCAVVFNATRAPTPAPPGSSDAWVESVQSLPPDKQVAAVVAKLKELNPGFDGQETHKIDKDRVTQLAFLTDDVTDLSPVRALRGLSDLQCSGSAAGKGKLRDLSPLQGMPLTWLNCDATEVADLSPLKGMPLIELICGATKVSDLTPLKDSPLTALWCHYTAVTDLSPLKGLPLTWLACDGTRVKDLSPLTGMPLKTVWCSGTDVTDLTPLKDMKLSQLGCNFTQVTDLTPLKDMKLTSLLCSSTGVKDLSPLKGMPLTELQCRSTRVQDLSPLEGMPLKALSCDFKPERDTKLLRAITTLDEINDKPVAEFWKEVDGK